MAGIVLAGATPRPPNRKIAKTARSTVRAVPYEEVTSAAEYLEVQAKQGTLILALELTDKSESLLSYTLPPAVVAGQQQLVLIPGGEAAGVAPEILEQCHGAIYLPMYGSNTSMNVAVATGAAIYLLLRQLQ